MSLLEDFGHLKPKYNEFYHSLTPAFSPQFIHLEIQWYAGEADDQRSVQSPPHVRRHGIEGKNCPLPHSPQEMSITGCHDVKHLMYQFYTILTLSDSVGIRRPLGKNCKIQNPKSKRRILDFGRANQKLGSDSDVVQVLSPLVFGPGKFSGNRCRSAKIASFWYFRGWDMEIGGRLPAFREHQNGVCSESF